MPRMMVGEEAGQVLNAPASILPEPSRVVAFLFTDIEESTRRWETWPQAMADALRRHDALLHDQIGRHGGHVFKTVGDAFCCTFERARDALDAAVAIQGSLGDQDFTAVEGLPVRIALHAGAAEERDGDYFGPALNRVARLLGATHGGQIVLTNAVAELIRADERDDVTLRDLGWHRFKDLAQPERVYQCVASASDVVYPSLRSLDSDRETLPVQSTSFVGRTDDLSELAARLTDARVVTLTGTGGVGKTRLAIEAGAALRERFPGGVWYVELAPVVDATGVAGAVAATLDIRVPPQLAVIDAIVTALRSRHALLILDNCEHVVGAAASLIAAVAQRCANVRILATSRQPLEISGEFVHRLGPLAVPSLADDLTVEAARGYGAIELFVARATAALQSFVLTENNLASVAEVCRRLDGIALAIELAASRIIVLSPQQLAARLHERFRLLGRGDRTALPRQQTLRALIDWSYDLLDEREQTVFRRCAAFNGGWTLEAASIVCGDAELDAWDVFELLSSLVAKSLVTIESHGDEQRFRYTESIREYAIERLKASGECPATATKHANYYTEYVARQSTYWEAMDEYGWRCRLATELDNLRAALQWTLEEKNAPQTGLSLLSNLHKPRLLMLQDEALRWFDLANASLETASPAVRATIARRYAAVNMHRRMPIVERIAVAERAVDMAVAVGDDIGAAEAAQVLGILLRQAGRLGDARLVFERYWPPLEVYDVPACKASFCGDWAAIEYEIGDLDSARGKIDECLRFARRGSMTHATASVALGELEFCVGDFEAARVSARAACAGFSAQRAWLNLGGARCNLAAYALALDYVGDARESLVEAIALLQRSNYLVLALEHTGVFAAQRGEFHAAVQLLGYTTAQYAELGQVRERTEISGYERAMGLLLQVYDADGLQRRLARAAELSQDEALRIASDALLPLPIVVKQ